MPMRPCSTCSTPTRAPTDLDTPAICKGCEDDNDTAAADAFARGAAPFKGDALLVDDDEILETEILYARAGLAPELAQAGAQWIGRQRETRGL